MACREVADMGCKLWPNLQTFPPAFACRGKMVWKKYILFDISDQKKLFSLLPTLTGNEFRTHSLTP